MEQISQLLKVTGMIAIALGLILGYADLKGNLKNKKRTEILEWVLTSSTGLALENPAAKEFMNRFPPPKHEDMKNLTHLTKQVVRLEKGGVYNASVNYMRKDFSRTNYVATLDEIRDWASESPYPLISWWITLIGFGELVGNWFIDKKLKQD